MKAISHGNSREQTSDNTSNCGGVCLFFQNKTTSWAIDSKPVRARRIIGKQLEIFSRQGALSFVTSRSRDSSQ